MNFIFGLFIFFIILFLYIHLIHQYKRSEDLEIYEMDYVDNQGLQEICNMKQPVLFDFNVIDENLIKELSDICLDKYSSFEIKIKDINDYFITDNDKNNSINYVVLNTSSSVKLMKTDTKSRFITENNNEFLEETGLINKISYMDNYLKPPLIIQSKYDFMFGSENSFTPLKFHTNYRQFYLVSTGNITVKMTPYKSIKYLDIIKDYENYEFYSQIPIWNLSNNLNDKINKVKFLEFNVFQGSIIFIPSYWFYSIKYNGSTTTVCNFIYNSPMNIISNLPDICKYFFQKINTNKKIVKTLNINTTIDETKQENKNTTIIQDNTVENIQIEKEKENNNFTKENITFEKILEKIK